MKIFSLFSKKSASANLQGEDKKKAVKSEVSKGSEQVQKEEGNDKSGEAPKSCEAKTEAHDNGGSTSIVYNLIILDESGSMSGVTSQTISGCNETLNGIRATAKENKEQKQYVSIYCFDTSRSRYLFENKPIEEVKELTAKDYRPNAATPLYDAIGNTVIRLQRIATDTDSVAKVTIITDGYENASKQWSHASIVTLIESMKKKEWLFTFIGANIDVERTSRDLGISSFMKFDQTDAGMKEMFDCERRSQEAYAKKMAYLRKRDAFRNACEEERWEMLGAMNENYFTEGERVAPHFIRSLAPDEVFVFGSNIMGNHNGGAAYIALSRFGAVMGQEEGMQGQSYAIPSVGCTFEDVRRAVERFTEYAVLHPDKKFMLTAIGCGNAGYTPRQIAPLFRTAYGFGNVYVPASFLPYVR